MRPGTCKRLLFAHSIPRRVIMNGSPHWEVGSGAKAYLATFAGPPPTRVALHDPASLPFPFGRRGGCNYACGMTSATTSRPPPSPSSNPRVPRYSRRWDDATRATEGPSGNGLAPDVSTKACHALYAPRVSQSVGYSRPRYYALGVG